MKARGALLVVALLLTGACTPGGPPDASTSAGVPSAVSTGPSCLDAPAPSSTPVVTASSGSKPVPDLALRCWTGGGTARLSQVRGPAIINLWASWCAPCKAELPALQRYASRAGDRVRVVGVVTDDPDRAAQQSVVDRFSLTFPMLDDPDKKLLRAVGRSALPVTLFVSGDGRVAYLYNAEALDEATIELFAENYLGVVIA